ncbi:MAG TPA: methyltransferase domain-containing protein [Chitinophagales bacterium]|nr:methyltransferase domain-containing protein [Chitinophagales bacterium]
MKDNFSKQSQGYAQFRPVYPPEIFEYLFSIVKEHEVAWDCATGNGQVASALAPYFTKVMATDISAKQIEQAQHKENIHYSIAPAEHTSFPENYFDLITVGQAIHWFDFSAFYSEAKRIAKQSAPLVALGYDLIHIDDDTDKIILRFYEEVLKGFWDPERKYVDEHYKTIPFPFREIQPPQFQLRLDWTLEHVLGFLGTWSGVQHYMDHHHRDPIDEIKNELMQTWKQDVIKTVSFSIMMRVGIIEK